MDNKERIRYFYEVVVSQNLLQEVQDYIASNSVVRMGKETTLLGVEGMKEHLIAVRKTYPDYQMHIIRQHQDGEYIISEFIMEGTHKGEWLGMKPTHKRLTFTGVDIDKVENGKIIEHGGAVNTFDTLFAEHIIGPTC